MTYVQTAHPRAAYDPLLSDMWPGYSRRAF